MSARLARLPLRGCSRRLFSQQTQTVSIVLPKAASSYEEFRQRHPVFAPIQVRWGDMDAFQHVNNVAYFRYLESARIAYMEAVSRHLPDSINRDEFMSGTGVSFIVSDLYFRYRAPVFYPDQLESGTSVQEIKEDRMVFSHEVWSTKQNKVIGLGYGTVVTFDFKAQRKVPIPEGMLHAVRALEACCPKYTDIQSSK